MRRTPLFAAIIGVLMLSLSIAVYTLWQGNQTQDRPFPVSAQAAVVDSAAKDNGWDPNSIHVQPLVDFKTCVSGTITAGPQGGRSFIAKQVGDNWTPRFSDEEPLDHETLHNLAACEAAWDVNGSN